jgi:hypothetical protein
MAVSKETVNMDTVLCELVVNLLIEDRIREAEQRERARQVHRYLRGSPTPWRPRFLVRRLRRSLAALLIRTGRRLSADISPAARLS